MNITGFHHIAFRTPDWDGAMKFWRDGLGFSPKLEWGEAPNRAAMLDLGDGNYFEIFEREPSKADDARIEITERIANATRISMRVKPR